MMQRADQMLNEHEVDEVTLQTLFLEIHQRADQEAAFRPALFFLAIATLQTALPYLWRLIRDEYMFDNKIHQAAELAILIPKLGLSVANFILMTLLNNYMRTRYHMKCQLLCMMNPKLCEELQIARDMPALHIYGCNGANLQ